MNYNYFNLYTILWVGGEKIIYRMWNLWEKPMPCHSLSPVGIWCREYVIPNLHRDVVVCDIRSDYSERREGYAGLCLARDLLERNLWFVFLFRSEYCWFRSRLPRIVCWTFLSSIPDILPCCKDIKKKQLSSYEIWNFSSKNFFVRVLLEGFSVNERISMD